MCASLSYTCMPWYLPGIWYYNRLILLLLKLGIVVIMILVIRWLIVILLYYLLSTILFILFSYSVYFHGVLWYAHMIYSCAPFLFLHTHWEFWLPKFTHPGIWVIAFTEQVFEKIMCIWGVQSLFCPIAGIFGTVHISLFILLTFFDSLLLGLHIYSMDLL